MIQLMLVLHVILSIASLVLHGMLAANHQADSKRYQLLSQGTIFSLAAASISGLLLNDGTLHSYLHIAGMLAMFLAIHAIIFGMRMRAKNNSQA
jgi:hypothetical protein